MQVQPGDTLASIAKQYYTNIKVLMQLNPCDGEPDSNTCPLPNEGPDSGSRTLDGLVQNAVRLYIGRLVPTAGKTLESTLSTLGITERLPLISVLNPGALVPTHEATRRRRAAGGNLLISGGVQSVDHPVHPPAPPAPRPPPPAPCAHVYEEPPRLFFLPRLNRLFISLEPRSAEMRFSQKARSSA